MQLTAVRGKFRKGKIKGYESCLMELAGIAQTDTSEGKRGPPAEATRVSF